MRNWSLDDAVLLLNASRPSIKKLNNNDKANKRKAQHILKPVKVNLLWTAMAESCYLLVISLSPRSCCQKQEARRSQLDGMALYFNFPSYMQIATSSETPGRIGTNLCDSQTIAFPCDSLVYSVHKHTAKINFAA